MSFTTAAVVLQDFTQDTALAGYALRNIKAAGGTALMDSIGTAVDYAVRHGRHDRKGIVLVTDGGEADSLGVLLGTILVRPRITFSALALLAAGLFSFWLRF
jgi:Mg-chelatase subunit ChlD